MSTFCHGVCLECHTFHCLKSLLQLLQTFATSTKSCDPSFKTMPFACNPQWRGHSSIVSPSENHQLLMRDSPPYTTSLTPHLCVAVAWHLRVASLLRRHSDAAANNTRTLVLTQLKWSTPTIASSQWVVISDSPSGQQDAPPTSCVGFFVHPVPH